MSFNLPSLVILSLTTIPERIQVTRKIIESELNELSGNFVIVLNLPLSYKNKTKTFTLDKNFHAETKKLEKLAFSSNGKFILNRCNDYGPLTKLLPTLSLNLPKESILLVRDDNCYHAEAFSILANRQIKELSKSFTYYSYEYNNTKIPQGVDIISFWLPNLSNFKTFAEHSLKNEYCFHVDDMVIGKFLKNNGIQVETVKRLWKWAWKPDCFNGSSNFSLFGKKGEYSRENSSKMCDKYI